MISASINQRRAALVVAHPSHELRVHGWLQMCRPWVLVLTDGSGRTGEPRLLSTTKVLDDVGAQPGSLYGKYRDSDVYDAFLRQDFSFFFGIAEDLAEELSSNKIEYVVGDADEGYSPTHDVCRLLTNAAVTLVRRRTGQQIRNFDFAVVGPPDECPAAIYNQAIWFHLDDDAFLQKLAAARGYNAKLALDVEAALRGELFKGLGRFSKPQLAGEVDKDLSSQLVAALHAYPEIEKNVRDALCGMELNRFRTECLRPVIEPERNQHRSGETQFYELYGEKMVAAGHYQEIIRYCQHFRPLEDAVWRYVENC